MTKAQVAERDDAIAKLREWIKPGDTVYTILDSVSRSGMSRHIRVVLLTTGDDGKPVDLHPNWAVGKALGYRHGKNRLGHETDALVVNGCGQDMGYEIVYNLGRVLFPVFGCLGKGCPSNDHSNGDRDYTIGHQHSDGGYALRHRWL